MSPAKYESTDAFFVARDQNQVVDDSAARRAAQVSQECDRLRARWRG